MFAYPVCVFFWFAAKYKQMAYSVYKGRGCGTFVTLDLGVGRLRLKQSGPIYVWMGRPRLTFGKPTMEVFGP